MCRCHIEAHRFRRAFWQTGSTTTQLPAIELALSQYAGTSSLCSSINTRLRSFLLENYPDLQPSRSTPPREARNARIQTQGPETVSTKQQCMIIKSKCRSSH
eukprot:6192019-Pleurochrysis_carterae.AAC.1